MARQTTPFIGILVATALTVPVAGAAAAGAGPDMVEAYADALGIGGAMTGPAAGATEALAPAGPDLALAAAPLPRDELGGMRAGFALPGGISLAFGFDIETRLAGVPVQRMTLPLTDIGSGAALVRIVEGAAVRSVPAQAGPIVSEGVFNAGGTRIRTVLDRGITSLVQNSRDGQVVQRRAAFQVDIVGMSRLLEAAGTRRVIDGALGAHAGRPR